MRILLAEDDDFLAGGIRLALSNAGYTVECVKSGPDADHMLRVNDYELLLLDLGLPKLDGMEVLRHLRARGKTLPVIILTARDALGDRVLGLDSGANDYLTKPFELPELLARVRAMTRKQMWGNSLEYVHGPLRFDTGSRRVTISGEAVDLSARELAVLELLLQRAPRVVNKDQIAEHLPNPDEGVTHNAIEILVHRLRKKLERDGFSIRTARGLGYLIDKV
jgi:two-component system OmpR family response regulator